MEKKNPFQNIVGKGENAGNQHFLFFPQCFLLYQRQKLFIVLHLFCRLETLSIWTRSSVVVWEWVKTKCMEIVVRLAIFYCTIGQTVSRWQKNEFRK